MKRRLEENNPTEKSTFTQIDPDCLEHIILNYHALTDLFKTYKLIIFARHLDVSC